MPLRRASLGHSTCSARKDGVPVTRLLPAVLLGFAAGLAVGAVSTDYFRQGTVAVLSERVSNLRPLQPAHDRGSSYLSTLAAAALGSAGTNTRVHIPPWVFALPPPTALAAAFADPKGMMALAFAASRSQDDEAKWAMQQYFWGRTGGTVLELGALDGKRYSNSFAFETQLGWRAINVEASPVSFDQLVRNRPGALNINLAVCAAPLAESAEGGPPPLLHFLVGPSPCCFGFWEFMSPAFRARWYPGVTDANVSQPHPAKGVTSTPTHCGPLAAYLSLFGVAHVDFWSLDVEGAELQVLRGFDFGRVTVDVIAVEADGGSPAAEAAVRAYLEARGFELQRPARPREHRLFSPRNAWFVRTAAKANLRAEPGKAAVWANAQQFQSSARAAGAAGKEPPEGAAASAGGKR